MKRTSLAMALAAGLTITQLSNATTVNVDFNGTSTFTQNDASVFPAPSGGNTFNGIGGTSFSSYLVDAAGNPTAIRVSGAAPAQDSRNLDSTNSGAINFQDTLVTNPANTSGYARIANLTPGTTYDLYLFGYFNSGNAASRENTAFTINGVTQNTDGSNAATTGFNLGEDYVKFSGVTPDAARQISISFTHGAHPNVGVFNGFQLVGSTSRVQPLSNRIVNVDFDGRRVGDESVPTRTFNSPGAAGGGNKFNSVPINSVAAGGGNDDNISVPTQSNLLASDGSSSGINFHFAPAPIATYPSSDGRVGGDIGPNADTPGGSDTVSQALFNDYFFINSSGNHQGAVDLVFDGLDNSKKYDLYFYGVNGGNIFLNGVAGANGGFEAGSNLGNSPYAFFGDVSPTNGALELTFNGVVMNGFTIAESAAVPEPAALGILAATGLFALRRPRFCRR